MNKPVNTDTFDEGLGTVYERFMVDNYFDRLTAEHTVQNVLEVPIYGMTGLTGINSVYFAIKGSKIILVDPDKEHCTEASMLLKKLPVNGNYEVICHKDLSCLPFSDNSFDLVWNFAAIWHVNNPDLLLKEMARVSSKLALIFVPNKKQPGYLLRKYVFDRRFFTQVDESWIDTEKIKAYLKNLGMNTEEEGQIDIPFWPDTTFPVKRLIPGMFKGPACNDNTSRKGLLDGIWNWDIMSYYMGENPDLRDKINRLAFLEKMPFPEKLRAFWAHHNYILCSKN